MMLQLTIGKHVFCHIKGKFQIIYHKFSVQNTRECVQNCWDSNCHVLKKKQLGTIFSTWIFHQRCARIESGWKPCCLTKRFLCARYPNTMGSAWAFEGRFSVFNSSFTRNEDESRIFGTVFSNLYQIHQNQWCGFAFGNYSLRVYGPYISIHHPLASPDVWRYTLYVTF